MSQQHRTCAWFSHRSLVARLGGGALLLGLVACGAEPYDAGVSPQREINGRDGKTGSTTKARMDGDEGPGPSDATDCTFTQGFWKNHASVWPVSELKLGSTSYSKAQLLDILRTPVSGNGLVALSHQLIAARLNLAYGAAPAGLENTLAEADARIGALVVPPIGSGSLPTTTTSALNDALTSFNEGKTGPGHCADAPKPPTKPSTPPPPAPISQPPVSPPPSTPPTQIVD